MTKAKQHAIRCYIAMRNHHEKMLEAAINRNDANAVAQETAKLAQIKANI